MRTKPMPSIRSAKPDDIEQIHQISATLGYEEVETDIALKNLNEILESGTNEIWVAEEKGNIVDWLHLFVSLRVASPKFAEIGGLAVIESERRRGVGRELVKEAIRWAASSRLAIKVRCNRTRMDANRLYESMGFELKKEQKVYESVIKM